MEAQRYEIRVLHYHITQLSYAFERFLAAQRQQEQFYYLRLFQWEQYKRDLLWWQLQFLPRGHLPDFESPAHLDQLLSEPVDPEAVEDSLQKLITGQKAEK